MFSRKKVKLHERFFLIRSKKQILILLGFLFFTLSLIIIGNNFFTVEEFQFESYSVACVDKERLAQEINNYKKKNILFIYQDEVEKPLVKKYHCVKNVVVRKKYPKQLNLQVYGREPIARVGSLQAADKLLLDSFELTPSSSSMLLDWSIPKDVSQSMFLMDDKGVIFEKSETNDFILVWLENVNLNIGDRLPTPIIEKLLIVLRKMKELGGLVTQVKITDNYLIAELGYKVAFDFNKDLLRQLASLQLILQKAKIENGEVLTIDLRFDKPVVVYGKR